MQPFEIIKVRLQTQPQDAKIYNGIIDCLTKIIKNEGPLALYKGDIFLMQGHLLL
jgi:solute carrier family 25 2-oxodicarboxylate transporter 21